MKVFYTKTYNMWNDNKKKQEIVEAVSRKLGYEEIALFKFVDTYDTDEELDVRIQGIMAPFCSDDILIFQYPSMVSMRYDNFVIKNMRLCEKAKLILFVEDLGSEIDRDNYSSLSEEIELFNNADLIILPSKKMHNYLLENGLHDIPVIYQIMWDYPYDICCYSDEICRNVEYIENLSIETLCDNSKCGFGIDKEFEGEYVDMCNPLRTGFYICKGMPIVSKNNSKLNEIVEKYQIGLSASSYNNVIKKVECIDDNELFRLNSNIKCLSKMVASGVFTSTLLQNAVFEVLEKDICGKK